MTPTEAKAIARIGIARGWIWKHPQILIKIDPVACVRNLRAARHAIGLTSAGKPRLKMDRPELNGLIGREYHREYMRRVRAGIY